jgi:hypothetical protein
LSDDDQAVRFVEVTVNGPKSWSLSAYLDYERLSEDIDLIVAAGNRDVVADELLVAPGRGDPRVPTHGTR